MAIDHKAVALRRASELEQKLSRNSDFREYLDCQVFIKMSERFEALAQVQPKGEQAPRAATAPRKGSSAAVVDAIEDLLIEAGRPMRISEIYNTLLAKGIEVTGKDPRKNISSKLYYEKDKRFLSHGPAGWTAVQGSSAPAQPGASDNLFGEDGQP